jgi:hypothetical protein
MNSPGDSRLSRAASPIPANSPTGYRIGAGDRVRREERGPFGAVVGGLVIVRRGGAPGSRLRWLSSSPSGVSVLRSPSRSSPDGCHTAGSLYTYSSRGLGRGSRNPSL